MGGSKLRMDLELFSDWREEPAIEMDRFSVAHKLQSELQSTSEQLDSDSSPISLLLPPANSPVTMVLKPSIDDLILSIFDARFTKLL